MKRQSICRKGREPRAIKRLSLNFRCLAGFTQRSHWGAVWARSETEAVKELQETLSHQGRRLLQLGVALFLFTSFEGFAIPALASPYLGRSVHTLSGFT